MGCEHGVDCRHRRRRYCHPHHHHFQYYYDDYTAADLVSCPAVRRARPTMIRFSGEMVGSMPRQRASYPAATSAPKRATCGVARSAFYFSTVLCLRREVGVGLVRRLQISNHVAPKRANCGMARYFSFSNTTRGSLTFGAWGGDGELVGLSWG